MFEDSATVKIHVVDQDDQPVPGATIWYINSREGREVPDDVLARQVARYAADADYVFGVDVHPLLLIAVTGPTGEATIDYVEGDFHGQRQVRTQFAALKRSYHPDVQVSDVAVNRTTPIVLHLARTNESVDPRMETLDRIRAEALGPSSLGMMSPERQVFLQGVQSRLQNLATQLERDGELDLAAAVYFNMSSLPSVTRVLDAAGNVIAQGYTSRYDPNSPERRANRERAESLVQSHPQIRFNQLYAKYDAEGVFVHNDKTKSASRRKYIDDAERYFHDYGERMWPSFHVRLWRTIREERGAEAACAALQRFYRFEPTYFFESQWQQEFHSLTIPWKSAEGPPTAECKMPARP